MNANVITEYSIYQRLIEVDDAEFILSLRLQKELKRFISNTDNDLNKQIEWILKYKERELKGEEYYFVALDIQGKRRGVTRIYDFTNNSFEFGSWIFERSTSYKFSIFALFAILNFAFYKLGFKFLRTTVRKNNNSMNRFHTYFKSDIINKDSLNNYYLIKQEDYEIGRDKFLIH